MSVVVLGTVALDTIKTPFGKRKDILGGSAVHFAMSCRLFTPVNLVAVIGKDFPKKYIDFLREKGIILKSLLKTCGKSFRWEGEYKDDLNCAITLNTELGVVSNFKPQLSEAQKNIKYVFLANVDPDIQRDLLSCLHSPDLVVLDTMNYWIKNKKRSLLNLLNKVDIFLLNLEEAKALTQETNLIKIAKSLQALGPKMILIKKAEHGVFFYSQKFKFSLPAYPTEEVVDPTGAGDTFAGGFLGYLAKVKRLNPTNIKKALIYGTIAASINIEGFGIEKTSQLTMQALNQRVKEFRKILVF